MIHIVYFILHYIYVIYNIQLKKYLIQFNSIQFIQFHQIHYKSKRPIGYRISHSTLYHPLIHKDSIHIVTVITQAGNKMSLIYGYLIN
jgi:hypothetical protein